MVINKWEENNKQLNLFSRYIFLMCSKYMVSVNISLPEKKVYYVYLGSYLTKFQQLFKNDL